MGLDMYFFQVPKGKEPGSNGMHELAYFRKHSDLHGWLEQEWNKNHADSGEDFNCTYMEITPAIFMRLKDYLTKPEKEHYSGFFWGESDERHWEETCELMPQIEEVIKSGDKVYYYSWW